MCTDNQTVEAGQPLIEIDDSEQQVAYAQAKAQYDQAVAQLNSQRPSLAITQANNAEAIITGDAQLVQAKAGTRGRYAGSGKCLSKTGAGQRPCAPRR